VGPSMHLPDGHQVEDPSLARIGAFSDGVFAFAITLLILAIRIPHPTDADASQGLLDLLLQQWQSLFAFALSFMVIGINWANHRVMFANFARANHGLVWLNLLYLMVGVAFMPIPTAVLGEWLGSPKNQVVATLFYGIASTIGGLVFNVVWWYGAYATKLTHPELTARERRAHTVAWAPAPVLVAMLTLVALANVWISVGGYAVIVLLYVLPLPRLVSRAKRARGR